MEDMDQEIDNELQHPEQPNDRSIVHRELLQSTETKKEIQSIQFSVMSEQDITKLGIIQIVNEKLYNTQTEGEKIPHLFGTLDRRLGTSEKRGVCETCKKKFDDCPGHFGYIKLELPVFHVGYLKHILRILQCICKNCSCLLLDNKNKKKYSRRLGRLERLELNERSNLFKGITEQCKKTKICESCNKFNGIVKKMPKFPMRIVHDKYKTKDEETMEELSVAFNNACQIQKEVKTAINDPSFTEELTPLKVQTLFQNILQSDIPYLELNPQLSAPQDLIINCLLVPPVCIRPTVPMGQGSTNEDDLTIKLTEILTFNSCIRTAIEQGFEMNRVLNDYTMLQATVAQYINSEAPGLPVNLLGSKKPIKSLVQRLKGKQGRFRSNLSGKRVDFSGRAVISPDPNLDVHQVCVPIHMAKVLTYPHKVTNLNIQMLKKKVIRGPHQHPGANYVEYTDGSRTFLSYGNRRVIADGLKIGDIVEAHLADNDIVLFNRQPSLHRLSIMAHIAKIMPERTLRFNVCVCTPYNADFDGDEMNIHVPQTEEARAEAYTLMGVRNNLCTPKNGDPIVACTQDFLTTAFLITQKDTFFDRGQFAQILGYITDGLESVKFPVPAILKPIELWTGKQVISALLRPNLWVKVFVNVSLKARNYSGQGMHMCKSDGWVTIINSEHLSGNLCKASMGGGSKEGLFYNLIKFNSPNIAAECMKRVAKLSGRWLQNYGMSIGISDVMPFQRLVNQKNNLLAQGYANCNTLIEKYKSGKMELKPGCNQEESIEIYLNGELSKMRGELGDALMRDLPKKNSALIMAICGSKGSNLNLCQMIACVGQQTVNGSRIPNGFVNRALPHFQKHSKLPADKGFVENSYFSGLSPTEFFFHTAGGREGLVDAAVKTADTGYMQRRLVKCLEDLTAKYDYSVRNSTEDIVQFLYGDDAYDPLEMDDITVPVSFSRLLLHVQSIFHGGRALMPWEITMRLEEYKCTLGYNNNNNNNNSKYIPRDEIHDPIHTNTSTVSPPVQITSQFFESLTTFFRDKCREIGNIREYLGLNRGEERDMNPTPSSTLHSQNISRIFGSTYKLTDTQLEEFLSACTTKLSKSLVHPGEAVGAVASQSIGEPATQMTLRTFHFAGVASMNVSLGMPRIKEIVNASKTMSTPLITANLINNSDLISARIVKGRIEKTRIGDIAEYIEEVYSPEGCHIIVRIGGERIQTLKLKLTMSHIRSCVLNTSKLKLREKNIEIQGEDLIIEPSEMARDKLYFSMQMLKRDIVGVVVVGIESVERAVINEIKSSPKEYNLILEGRGLGLVLASIGVDHTQTTSNDILETNSVLGIEAARSTIIHEIVYCLQQYGLHIDVRHIGLLADVMTYKGNVLGITRFGVSKMKDSTLMLASFEQTGEHLFNAAVQCKNDTIKGVSESIIVGQPIRLGSGLFKLLYNHQADVKEKGNPASAKEKRSGEEKEKHKKYLFDNVHDHISIDFDAYSLQSMKHM